MAQFPRRGLRSIEILMYPRYPLNACGNTKLLVGFLFYPVLCENVAPTTVSSNRNNTTTTAKVVIVLALILRL